MPDEHKRSRFAAILQQAFQLGRNLRRGAWRRAGLAPHISRAVVNTRSIATGKQPLDPIPVRGGTGNAIIDNQGRPTGSLASIMQFMRTDIDKFARD